MRILRSIVAPSAMLVAFCDSKMTGRSGIRSEIIRDELVWDKAVFLQKLAHEFQCRPFVPFRLDQHVEDLTLGIDGAPNLDHAAIDFQIDLVQMPSRMGLRSAFAQVRCDHWSEVVLRSLVRSGLLSVVRVFGTGGSLNKENPWLVWFVMLCGFRSVQQAAIGNCLSFDPFPFDQNGLAPPEVDVGWRQIADALVIAPVIVICDEGRNLGFEITWQ
jgi:hypothetical protein